jgi:hypothetical protein
VATALLTVVVVVALIAAGVLLGLAHALRAARRHVGAAAAARGLPGTAVGHGARLLTGRLQLPLLLWGGLLGGLAVAITVAERDRGAVLVGALAGALVAAALWALSLRLLGGLAGRAVRGADRRLGRRRASP